MQNSHLEKLPDRLCGLLDKSKNTNRHLRSGAKFNDPENKTDARRNLIHDEGRTIAVESPERRPKVIDNRLIQEINREI